MNRIKRINKNTINRELVNRKKIKMNKKGMEMVQVAILVAIAIGLGLIFKDKIGEFVNSTFAGLVSSKI